MSASKFSESEQIYIQCLIGIFRGVGGSQKKNPFHGRGIDIFWNFKIIYIFKGNMFLIKVSSIVPLKGKLTVPRSSILETRFSILDSQKLRGSRLESSFKTFKAFREFVETIREFIESSFQTFEWEKHRYCFVFQN